MAKMSKAARSAAAKKGWRKRKMGKSSSKAKKSPAKKAAAHKGKKVASASFGGAKFACHGKKVRVGKKRTKVARVFCARA
jgi:hypothetical protein